MKIADVEYLVEIEFFKDKNMLMYILLKLRIEDGDYVQDL